MRCSPHRASCSDSFTHCVECCDDDVATLGGCPHWLVLSSDVARSTKNGEGVPQTLLGAFLDGTLPKAVECASEHLGTFDG